MLENRIDGNAGSFLAGHDAQRCFSPGNEMLLSRSIRNSNRPPSLRSEGKTYATLDAMRGIAAIGVVTYHAPDLFGKYAMRGGWLAVDLFFCLSGFVIAHAYGWQFKRGLGAIDFLRVRLVRLYPMFLLSVVMSTGLMTMAALLGNGTTHFVKWLPTSILFLPTPFEDALYPMNLPAWSLFMEITINVLAALSWRWLTTPWLTLIIILCAGGLVIISLPLPALRGGDGWDTIHLGLLRVGFSFFAGVAVYRMHSRISLPKVPPSVLMLFLGACLASAAAFDVRLQLLLVIVAFPTLVALGAVVEPRLIRISGLAGRLSYGIYILHAGALGAARAVENQLPQGLPPPGAGLLFLAALLPLCWIADRVYDQPVRRKLRPRGTVSAREQAAF